MSNEFVACPLCKEEMTWMLSLVDEEGNWRTTYGCLKRCQEDAQITFGDKK